MKETRQATFTRQYHEDKMQAQFRAYRKAGLDHKKIQSKWRPKE